MDATTISEIAERAVSEPRLPDGRYVELPDRGRTFVREVAGPAGAPVVVLLHGWTATADLNWFAAFEPLGEHYRVIALDHRGHGRGLRCDDPFALEHCADDVAALLDVLGIERCTLVGYSMGGPIAQLVWQRHRRLVDGLVLCATSSVFNASAREHLLFQILESTSAAARRSRVCPVVERLGRVVAAARARRRFNLTWVVEQVARHQWTALLEAGRALGRFDSRAWIGQVDVPVAVVVTLLDEVVAPARQLGLAAAITGATVHPVASGHSASFHAAPEFLPRLLEACRSIVERLDHAVPAAPPSPVAAGGARHWWRAPRPTHDPARGSGDGHDRRGHGVLQLAA